MFNFYRENSFAIEFRVMGGGGGGPFYSIISLVLFTFDFLTLRLQKMASQFETDYTWEMC